MGEGELLPLGEGSGEAIAELQLGGMAEALAEALVEGEGATGEIGIHRHHRGWPWGLAAMKRCCPWWNW